MVNCKRNIKFKKLQWNDVSLVYRGLNFTKDLPSRTKNTHSPKLIGCRKHKISFLREKIGESGAWVNSFFLCPLLILDAFLWRISLMAISVFQWNWASPLGRFYPGGTILAMLRIRRPSPFLLVLDQSRRPQGRGAKNRERSKIISDFWERWVPEVKTLPEVKMQFIIIINNANI